MWPWKGTFYAVMGDKKWKNTSFPAFFRTALTQRKLRSISSYTTVRPSNDLANHKIFALYAFRINNMFTCLFNLRYYLFNLFYEYLPFEVKSNLKCFLKFRKILKISFTEVKGSTYLDYLCCILHSKLCLSLAFISAVEDAEFEPGPTSHDT
jgi:hypothetical protein